MARNFQSGISGIEVDTTGVRAQVALMKKMGVRSVDARPSYDRIEAILREQEEQVFSTRNYGAWPALKETTKQTKARKNQPATIMRVSDALYNSLTKRGKLPRGRWRRARKTELRWGTRVFYAFFHQEGHGHLSKREVVNVDPAHQKAISKVLGSYVSFGFGASERYFTKYAMSDDAVFGSQIGSIVSASDVELAALNTLSKWGSTYLGEAEDQHGRVRGSLPRPRSYTTTNSFDKWPEDQLPCVLLVCPGLSEPPRAEGNGSYRAMFALGVAAIVSAAKASDTEALAKLYVAALRTCLVQQRSLGGLAAGVDWLDESYDDLPSEDSRSLGAGQAVFAVHVDDLSRRYTGPVRPDAVVPSPPHQAVATDPVATDVQADVVLK